MTKLLQNKSIIKFLGIALSILLIVALVPQINIAYGSKDDVLADTGTEETADIPETEDTEGVDAELPLLPEEDSEVEEFETVDETNSSNMVGEENATEYGESDAETVQEAAFSLSANAGATQTTNLPNNESQIIDKDETNESGMLRFDGRDVNCTLTVNGTLRSDIRVTNGATLTIKGEGKIIGNGDVGQGSVIVVEKAAKLVFSGPTVTGGTGTTNPNTTASGWGKMGGGILVCRSTGENPAWNTARSCLVFEKGTIEGNQADTGGGILIDGTCGFTMLGGTV